MISFVEDSVTKFWFMKVTGLPNIVDSTITTSSTPKIDTIDEEANMLTGPAVTTDTTTLSTDRSLEYKTTPAIATTNAHVTIGVFSFFTPFIPSIASVTEITTNMITFAIKMARTGYAKVTKIIMEFKKLFVTWRSPVPDAPVSSAISDVSTSHLNSIFSSAVSCLSTDTTINVLPKPDQVLISTCSEATTHSAANDFGIHMDFECIERGFGKIFIGSIEPTPSDVFIDSTAPVDVLSVLEVEMLLPFEVSFASVAGSSCSSTVAIPRSGLKMKLDDYGVACGKTFVGSVLQDKDTEEVTFPIWNFACYDHPMGKIFLS
ncbi:unnamed protein product [Ambrosiozyma monospora]|uniref:Unnamed protein product n=1 Tax=Ambrosiozyma monospora TaxID=43982 RepID=A0A9W7DIJ5_AMBMO|nr:unnamed protein product [Ambrosiozyma monospora]